MDYPRTVVWYIEAREQSGPDKPPQMGSAVAVWLRRDGAFNDVCLRFGKFGLDSVCASPEIANNEWLKELAPGNAFALAANQPVPVALAAEPSTLTDIAATLP